jgi:hypothetical protein
MDILILLSKINYVDTMDILIYRYCHGGKMASARKMIEFNDYLDFINKEAARSGWGKTLLMHYCAIPRQRWSEFKKGRTLTGRYFLKFMEGLNLSIKDIEAKSGRKMSEEQKRELQIESWQAAHRDLIEAMIDNPGLVNVVQAAIKSQKK